jgi:hypothetical protein
MFLQRIGLVLLAALLPIKGAAGSAQLVLYPNPALGGQPALGQLTFAPAAGAGGMVVYLTSSSPAAAAVPATLTVPPGASNATFAITTYAVIAPTVAAITSNSSAGSATASLQVLPVPPPRAASTNLLVNGSFEQPHGNQFSVSSGVTGWSILQGTIDFLTSSYWQSAPDGGSQSLDLDGASVGTIQQSFPTVPGQDYLFSGYVSHNPSVAYGRANVLLNGVFFAQLAHTIPDTNANMQWQPFTYPFHATAATTMLAVSDVTGINTSQGTVLDGLSVTPVTSQAPSDTPAIPTGLRAAPVSAHLVSLTWDAGIPGATGLDIWRRSATSDWARIADYDPRSTRYVDASVQANTAYTYRLRSHTDTLVSAWSNEVSVTTSGP